MDIKELCDNYAQVRKESLDYLNNISTSIPRPYTTGELDYLEAINIGKITHNFKNDSDRLKDINKITKEIIKDKKEYHSLEQSLKNLNEKSRLIPAFDNVINALKGTDIEINEKDKFKQAYDIYNSNIKNKVLTLNLAQEIYNEFGNNYIQLSDLEKLADVVEKIPIQGGRKRKRPSESSKNVYKSMFNQVIKELQGNLSLNYEIKTKKKEFISTLKDLYKNTIKYANDYVKHINNSLTKSMYANWLIGFNENHSLEGVLKINEIESKTEGILAEFKQVLNFISGKPIAPVEKACVNIEQFSSYEYPKHHSYGHTISGGSDYTQKGRELNHATNGKNFSEEYKSSINSYLSENISILTNFLNIPEDAVNTTELTNELIKKRIEFANASPERILKDVAKRINNNNHKLEENSFSDHIYKKIIKIRNELFALDDDE
jgi:hypothetical protein